MRACMHRCRLHAWRAAGAALAQQVQNAELDVKTEIEDNVRRGWGRDAGVHDAKLTASKIEGEGEENATASRAAPSCSKNYINASWNHISES